MTFVTAGLAVAGLAAIAVPILIFLLWRQRRAPIEWAAMRFLLEAFRKHRRRLQVEQLLLLAIRCLVLAMLGLALARPLLKSAGLLDASGSRLVYLVIDNGLASGLVTADVGAGGGRALDGHIARAVEIIDDLDAGDRVGLILAARPARAVLNPPSSDHAAVVDLLEALEPAQSPTDLPGALDQLAAILTQFEGDHDRAFVYMLSEFRSGSAALDERLPSALEPLADRVVLRASPPATESVENVQITAIDPARSLILPGAMDGSGQVTVRVRRQGGGLDRGVSRVRLVGDGLGAVDERVIQWTPGQTDASAEFLLDIGAQPERETGIAVTIDDDALAADNDRFTVLSLRKQIRVVLLDRRSFGFEPSLDRLTAGQWITRALAPTDTSPVEIVVIEPAALDVADLRVADAAVIPRPDLLTDAGWPLLRRFVDGGGLVIITPPADLNVHRWTDQIPGALGLPWHIEREVEEIDVALADEQPPSSLLRLIGSDLKGLCLPIRVEKRLPVDLAQSQGDAVLRFADGRAFLIAGSPPPATDRATGRASATPGAPGARETSAEPATFSRGLVVYLATAPDLAWTNLPSKPLMVPLVQEVLRQGLSLIRASRPIGVGGRPAMMVGPAAEAIIAPDGSRIALTQTRRPDEPFAASGLYTVVDGAAQTIGAIAVNVEPAAGRTDPQPAAAVTAWLGGSGPWAFFDADDLGAALRRVEGGSPIAGILLLIVLGLILLETLLARWFSHSYRAEGGDVGRGLVATMRERPLHNRAAPGAGGAR